MIRVEVKPDPHPYCANCRCWNPVAGKGQFTPSYDIGTCGVFMKSVFYSDTCPAWQNLYPNYFSGSNHYEELEYTSLTDLIEGIKDGRQATN